MHFFSAVTDYFGGFMHPGVNGRKRTPPSAKASALSKVHQSEAGQPSAGMCSLVIEEPRTAIESDPALSILLKLRRWQRLRLVESRIHNGDCAIRIMVEPAGRVAVLSGPDARSICDALTRSGEAWGRVLAVGNTAVGTYRVDLILFWRKK
ncbi:hypothetical protein [Terriglobus aquaticus]|uniref:Uncharacterized protein n=1 Tax=Terriglobus aquaticus TaxID=940139 RepID=A0ABW9KIX3_9BACT|nr:hypothetical protein [Terriglobus aquaticus]